MTNSTKSSGLGDHFAFGGFLVGGDVQSLDMHGGNTPLDVTDITQFGHSRLGGQRAGEMSIAAFFDNAAGGAHAAFSPLTRADVIATYLRGQAIGNPALSQVSRQLNYDPTRAGDGMLTEKVDAQSDGVGQEWGNQLTAGPRTDTAATQGASWDRGGGFTTPAVPASTTPVTNTTGVPATVVITGGTVTAVTVGGTSAGSGDGTYVVPAGSTIAVTYSVAPTWTWTLSSGWGAEAYLQAIALTGTDVTVTVQHSPDNATWISLLAFTEVVSGNSNLPPSAQRIATPTYAFTATLASPAVFTVTGSAPANGTPLQLQGSSLPGGFTAGTTYYVVSSSGSTFELSATSGGSGINSSSAGSGTAYPVVQRYLRAVTTTSGGFTSFQFIGVVCANQIAVTS